MIDPRDFNIPPMVYHLANGRSVDIDDWVKEMEPSLTVLKGPTICKETIGTMAAVMGTGEELWAAYLWNKKLPAGEHAFEQFCDADYISLLSTAELVIESSPASRQKVEGSWMDEIFWWLKSKGPTASTRESFAEYGRLLLDDAVVEESPLRAVELIRAVDECAGNLDKTKGEKLDRAIEKAWAMIDRRATRVEVIAPVLASLEDSMSPEMTESELVMWEAPRAATGLLLAIRLGMEPTVTLWKDVYLDVVDRMPAKNSVPRMDDIIGRLQDESLGVPPEIMERFALEQAKIARNGEALSEQIQKSQGLLSRPKQLFERLAGVVRQWGPHKNVEGL